MYIVTEVQYNRMICLSVDHDCFKLALYSSQIVTGFKVIDVKILRHWIKKNRKSMFWLNSDIPNIKL